MAEADPCTRMKSPHLENSKPRRVSDLGGFSVTKTNNISMARTYR